LTHSVVVDSSALLAFLLGEEDAEKIVDTLTGADERWVSGFTVLETSVVLAARKGEKALTALDAFLYQSEVKTVPMTNEHARLAREAWLQYGKGRHPAALNLGDCCSYALARSLGVPLLAKGGDFAKTDIQTAL
jgi:ribonuclease VapC